MTEGHSLRADARRNRERILAAAEEIFVQRGAGASLEDVARRAGVGIGTVYRRFPTRDALLAAAYNDRFLSFAQACRHKAAELDPVAAIRSYIEELVLHTGVYRGLAASLGTVLQIGTPGCHATSAEGVRLLEHAQEAGAVRADVTFDDLLWVITAISLAVEREPSPQARIAHWVGLFLDGISLRAAPRESP